MITQIKLSVTKMSDEFYADYKFGDRDADQCAFSVMAMCLNVLI